MAAREGRKSSGGRESATARTHVVIIGNGPAGLALSAYLSGVHPFYNAQLTDGHVVEPQLHELLSSESRSESLIHQSLEWAEAGNWESGAGARPFARLLDQLLRPPGLSPLAAADRQTIVWRRDERLAVEHVLLGETGLGGSWNNFDPDMVAVSVGGWLDLPGLRVADWLGRREAAAARLPAFAVLDYLKDYAAHFRLDKSASPGTRVERVERDDENEGWLVSGLELATNERFVIFCKHVVLACGNTQPRPLQFDHADASALRDVLYDVRSFKDRLNLTVEEPVGSSQRAVVVVGSGISAADAVAVALDRGLRIIHVIRRGDAQLRGTVIARLASGGELWADYAKIYRLMTGREKHPLYTRMTSARPVAARRSDENNNDNSGNVLSIDVQSAQGVVEINCWLVVACCGRTHRLPNGLDEYSFRDYDAVDVDGLHAVGAFAGDHYVRHLTGGALHVARRIYANLSPPLRPTRASNAESRRTRRRRKALLEQQPQPEQLLPIQS